MVSSPLESMTLPATAIAWLSYSIRLEFPSLEQAFSPLDSPVGYPHNIRAPIALLRLSCLSGHCCGSQASYMGRTIDVFFPLATCTFPLCAVRASPQEAEFQLKHLDFST